MQNPQRWRKLAGAALNGGIPSHRSWRCNQSFGSFQDLVSQSHTALSGMPVGRSEMAGQSKLLCVSESLVGTLIVALRTPGHELALALFRIPLTDMDPQSSTSIPARGHQAGRRRGLGKGTVGAG